jgi:hypothetical protein
MTDLITLMWSFSLYRLITLKRSPVISLKHEVAIFFGYGVMFFLIMIILSLILIVLH